MDEALAAELASDFVKTMIQLGFIPGFMLCTVLHLLGYGIFKGIALLNIRS